MMAFRSLLLALAACALTAGPSAAQTAAPEPDIAAASRALSAMWRPLQTMTAEAATAACGGAAEEIEAVEAALPPVLTPESLARVRTLHGLLIVPSDDPAIPYFFPDRSMDWFASGLGVIAVLSEQQGVLGVHDAAGHTIPLQLGSAGGRPVLRVSPPDGSILTFVGCAPTWGL